MLMYNLQKPGTINGGELSFCGIKEGFLGHGMKEGSMKLKMFATARRYEGVTDSESAAKKVDEVFVPLISALPGFVEYLWIDLGNGAMMSITIFETLSEAIAANEISRIWVKDLLSSVLGPSVRIEAGQIVAYKGK
jgi:hypothetical protein